jgi:predicted MFS family arabinose efflux permease
MAAGFIAEVSYRAGFLLEAGMTAVCAVVVFMKIPESRPEKADTGRPGEEIGLGTVLRDRRFMGVVGLCFLVALVFQQGAVGLPVAMGAAGFSPADYGLAIGVNGVLIVALQIPVTRFIERRDAGRILVVSSLLAGYGFGLTAFAGSVGVFALTVCVWTLGEMLNAPTQTGLVVRLSPAHGRGRYQGVYTLSWSVAALVAPLMSGLVIDRLGAAWLWALCAAVGTVAAVGYGALTRRPPADAPGATIPVAASKPETSAA